MAVSWLSTLLDRRTEPDLLPAALTHGTALTVWSPLAGGLLTGKYLDRSSGAGGRPSPDNEWGAKHFSAAADAAVAALAKVADQLEESLTALSLAWTLQRPGISSLVIGPRNTDQFLGLLAPLNLTLDDDLLNEIDGIVPAGGLTVPHYLDDSVADFRPRPYHW
jgi:aryl-alcohol dehydrogenase-like predicted oxidoreductase